MSSFTSPLRVQVLEDEWDGRATARLLEPFVFFWEVGDTKEYIRVPAGFVTDFNSVPWFARGLMSPFDRGAKAGVLHDWLLYAGKHTKVECAQIFLQALEVLNVAPWKRYLMFVSVAYWPWTKKVQQPDESISST